MPGTPAVVNDSNRGSGGAEVMHDSTGTHREAGFRVDLILRCYSEASVTVSCCPGEVNGGLQLFIHLLINGATKLRPIVSANKRSTDAKSPRKAGRSRAELPASNRGQGGCKRTHLLTKQVPNYRKPDRNGTDTRGVGGSEQRVAMSTITGNTQWQLSQVPRLQ